MHQQVECYKMHLQVECYKMHLQVECYKMHLQVECNYVNYAPTSRMLIDNANTLNRKMIKANTSWI